MKNNANSIAFFVLFAIFGQFQSKSESITKTFETFWPAICKIESDFNAFAVGDNKKAIGISQIHLGCLIDSNNYAKTKYSHEDCFDPNKSKIICFNYMRRYAKFHNWELNKMARLWNGGPGGVKSKKTDGYVKKFAIALKNP